MPGPRAFHSHLLIFHIVGRGLDPSAARRGRRPLQGWPEIIPAPIYARGGLRAGRPTISRSPHPVGKGFIPPVPLPASTRLTIHSVGAAYMPPATFPPPAANLPPPTNHCIPAKPFRPPPPIICAPQPPSPQYTPCPNFSLKPCRKNQKNLQKPVDKGHASCYNNQAVSRAQPAAAAAEAFTYSLYAVF